MPVRRTILIGSAVVALFAAGCGDDDSGSDTLTEDEFVELANDICAEGAADLEQAASEFDGEEPNTATILAFYTDTAIPNIDAQFEAIRELNPPEDMVDDVNEMLDEGEAALETFRQGLEDDPEAFLSSDEDPFAAVNAIALELGLTECGSEGE